MKDSSAVDYLLQVMARKYFRFTDNFWRSYHEWGCKRHLNTWNSVFTAETYLCYLPSSLPDLTLKKAAHDSVFLRVHVIGCVHVMRCVEWKGGMTFSCSLTFELLKLEEVEEQGVIIRARNLSGKF